MEILEYVLQGGPVGIAALLFWLLVQERRERKEAQEKLLSVSNSLIEHATRTEAAIIAFTELLKGVQSILERVREKIDNR